MECHPRLGKKPKNWVISLIETYAAMPPYLHFLHQSEGAWLVILLENPNRKVL